LKKSNMASSKTHEPSGQEACARGVPACGGDSVYSPANRYRPFCSERCKQIDLGAWASEDFRMPAEAPPADALSIGDPRLEH
jgi:endogenous inhibitor of DNA gyrase (YacG/DUF329 family)